ncbi:transcription antiterminator [Aerococcus agrisoli]|uniref:Ascorbate-specific PTS system EIIA component n=1 Tax=Aerococcus agrisoli TaxID=2487350 RepID=A0A3N4GE30_9LACT|nr:PTS sugar transporter subunit IIA [Aerococcus agrisoli]RPA60972.1 transcription antiterminator [Aerococcus agrisoli]
MNERIRNILTHLIMSPNIKMAQLSKEMGLTRRQINYAINQFNDELLEKEFPQIERNHNGDFIVSLEIVKLLSPNQFTLSAKGEDTVYTEFERRSLIIIFLITNTTYISLDHLTDLLNVSKSTVMEDMKRVEAYVRNYGLLISYNRNEGYQVSGSEHRVLQLLSDLIKNESLFYQHNIKNIMAPNVLEEETLHLIHNMEQMLHVNYSDKSIEYLQSAVRFLIQRGLDLSNKKSNFFKGQVRDSPEFKFLRVLLDDYPWKLNTSYLEWLALLFLSSNINERKTTQVYDSDNTLISLITKMVDSFESQTLIKINERDAFERRILNHLRPACFRIKFNLNLGVYSESAIYEANYIVLNDLMKELIVPIENWLGKAFPNDELELLSYYFGFQLTNPSELNHTKPRAVVVCTNGVIVSKLMRENLDKLFPELHFLASFSVRNFYKFEDDYDVVFTTTPLQSNILQYIINPIMTLKEQVNLKYRVLKDLGINEIDSSVEDLLEIIREHALVNDTKDLRKDLEYFLLKIKQGFPLDDLNSLPSLTHYLKPHFITLTNEDLSWEEAISLSCKPLMEEQIIDEKFINDCIQQVRDKNYSSFLGMRTCIPHTTVENGVLKDGISILISKKPIEFPNGRRINFIFPLSFYDLTMHLKTVNQIADISNNVPLLDSLLEESDEKEIYQILRKIT